MAIHQNFNTDVNGNIVIAGTGTAGAPGPEVVTVQGTTGMVPLATVRNAGTSTITTLAASTSTAVVLPANPNRRALMFYNTGNSKCYLAYAATASTSVYSVQMQSGSSFEPTVTYTGIISAVFSTNSGSLLTTEMT